MAHRRCVNSQRSRSFRPAQNRPRAESTAEAPAEVVPTPISVEGLNKVARLVKNEITFTEVALRANQGCSSTYGIPRRRSLQD